MPSPSTVVEASCRVHVNDMQEPRDTAYALLLCRHSEEGHHVGGGNALPAMQRRSDRYIIVTAKMARQYLLNRLSATME